MSGGTPLLSRRGGDGVKVEPPSSHLFASGEADYLDTPPASGELVDVAAGTLRFVWRLARREGHPTPTGRPPADLQRGGVDPPEAHSTIVAAPHPTHKPTRIHHTPDQHGRAGEAAAP